MSRTIRIDEQVYARLQEIAAKENKPFTSPNNVIRFMLKIDSKLTEGKRSKSRCECSISHDDGETCRCSCSDPRPCQAPHTRKELPA